MKNNILLSLVIPAYNTELYIKKCLDSILSQNIACTTYEIIVIDDGSTDGSLAILEEYKIYQNFKLISQNNKGAGIARNAGIIAASGEYIGFLDSDDYYIPETLKTLLDTLIKSKPDILEFAYLINDIKTNRIDYINTKNPNISENEHGKIVFFKFCASKCFQTIVWNRFYKSELIKKNNLLFKELKTSEDVEWLIRIFFNANKITYLPIVAYCHLYNRDMSIVSNPNIKNYIDQLRAIEYIENFIESIENRQNLIIKNFKYAVKNLQSLLYIQSFDFNINFKSDIELINKLKYNKYIINDSKLIKIKFLRILFIFFEFNTAINIYNIIRMAIRKIKLFYL